MRRSPNCISVGDDVILWGEHKGKIVACPTGNSGRWAAEFRGPDVGMLGRQGQLGYRVLDLLTRDDFEVVA